MYFITIYDYKEDNEWIFMKDIASIEEAKKLKDALEISFKMVDVQERTSVHIREKGWYVH